MLTYNTQFQIAMRWIGILWMDEKLFFHLLDLTILNSLLYCHFVGAKILHHTSYKTLQSRKTKVYSNKSRWHCTEEQWTIVGRNVMFKCHVYFALFWLSTRLHEVRLCYLFSRLPHWIATVSSSKTKAIQVYIWQVLAWNVRKEL